MVQIDVLCIDSLCCFVLRIQNAQGRHMFIGLVFNERNDAFMLSNCQDRVTGVEIDNKMFPVG